MDMLDKRFDVKIKWHLANLKSQREYVNSEVTAVTTGEEKHSHALVFWESKYTMHLKNQLFVLHQPVAGRVHLPARTYV